MRSPTLEGRRLNDLRSLKGNNLLKAAINCRDYLKGVSLTFRQPLSELLQRNRWTLYSDDWHDGSPKIKIKKSDFFTHSISPRSCTYFNQIFDTNQNSVFFFSEFFYTPRQTCGRWSGEAVRSRPRCTCTSSAVVGIETWFRCLCSEIVSWSHRVLLALMRESYLRAFVPTSKKYQQQS